MNKTILTAENKTIYKYVVAVLTTANNHK